MRKNLRDHLSKLWHAGRLVPVVVAAIVVCMCCFVFGDRGERWSENERIGDALAEEPQELPSEDSEIEESTDPGAEIMRRFRSVDWEQVQPRTYLKDDDWNTNIVCLAELPEDGIIMYGYNDEDYRNRGVAISMGGSMYYFDWYYFTPREVLPCMYWDEKRKQLQISLHIYTGTSVDAEELHVLQMTEEGLEDNWFTSWEYGELLSGRIGFSYEKDTHRITLYDSQNDKELLQADLSWLEEKEVENIVFGEIARFHLGDEICLQFTPGYVVSEWAVPQYEEMPELAVRIQMEISGGQVVFGLGEMEESPIS